MSQYNASPSNNGAPFGKDIMSLQYLLEIIGTSSLQDWNIIHLPYGGNRYAYEKIAVYKSNIDISIRFANDTEVFEESWTSLFPNKRAYSVPIHFCYRGSVVYQWIGIAVDGDRELVPRPHVGGDRFIVKQDELSISQLLYLLHSPINNGSHVVDTIKGVGITIIP